MLIAHPCVEYAQMKCFIQTYLCISAVAYSIETTFLLYHFFVAITTCQKDFVAEERIQADLVIIIIYLNLIRLSSKHILKCECYCHTVNRDALQIQIMSRMRGATSSWRRDIESVLLIATIATLLPQTRGQKADIRCCVLVLTYVRKMLIHYYQLRRKLNKRLRNWRRMAAREIECCINVVSVITGILTISIPNNVPVM